jgi:hypothetical protein
MDKPKLLEELDTATNLAASIALKKGVPIPISKKSTLVGNLLIEKNRDGFFDIVNFNKNTLHKDISVFDVAMIVAQKYISNDFSSIKKVLYLESRFVKYHIDMTHYLHCMKSAKKKKDIERYAILQDKFQTAEMLAENIKNNLNVFKTVK